MRALLAIAIVGVSSMATADSRVCFAPATPHLPSPQRAQIETILTRRLADFGTKSTLTVGDDRFCVDVAEPANLPAIVELVERRGTFALRIVDEASSYMMFFRDLIKSRPDSFGGIEISSDTWRGNDVATPHADVFLHAPTRASLEHALERLQTIRTVPTDRTLLVEQRSESYWRSYYALAPLAISESSITSVDVVDKTRLMLTLDGNGAHELERATAANVGHKLAIVVDDTVILAPVIDAMIGKNVQISASATSAKTRTLATALRCGALPVKLLRVN